MANQERREGFGPVLPILTAVIAMLLILPFGFGVRAYRMPSGSMQPALNPGEMFLVTKWTYGYGRYSSPLLPFLTKGRVLGRAPQRGELVVFRPTPEPDRDFVKRLIGLPGDRIQMIGGVLHINGEAVELEPIDAVELLHDGVIETVSAFRETLPGGASYVVLDRAPNGELDNTRVYVVPADSYFVMGDDRDNSADSRVPAVVGFVPIENFIGPVSWIAAP